MNLIFGNKYNSKKIDTKFTKYQQLNLLTKHTPTNKNKNPNIRFFSLKN